MKAIDPRKISSTDLAGVAVSLMLSAVFALGVLHPLHDKGLRSAAATDAAARERQHVANLQATIQALSTDLDRRTTQVSSNPFRLLPASGLNTRLADVASLANACRLTIKDLKPGDAIPTAHGISLPIQMTGSGNYCDLARLIHLLHQQLPDLEVNTFRLTANADEPRANCNFDLELQWRASAEPPMQANPQSTADLR
jgi:Tfp pilus assembly protein PilO